MRFKAYFAMLLVVFMYSGNILVGKGINDLPPFTIAFGRLFVAFLVLTPFGFLQALNDRNLYLQYKRPVLIMTLTGVTFFSSFIYSALQFTSSTNVSVLETVIPALTVSLSVLILKEKIDIIQWAGVVISFFGAVWVVTGGNIGYLFRNIPNFGDLIMIAAIISWSVYSIYVKRYMHYFKVFGIVWAMTGISVIILVPFILTEYFVFGVPALFTFENLTGILYLGVCPSFIALILYSRSVTVLGAGKASVMLNLLPVFTMIGAYYLLNEEISTAQIIGSVIVIAGVSMTTIKLIGKISFFSQNHPG